MINRRIVLASRPDGRADASNFRFETVETPPLAEGQVLLRHHYLSLDPYMRMRMSAVKSYAPPQPIGEAMVGGTVGEVVESRHPKWQVGDFAVSLGGWQEWSVVDADEPRLMRAVASAEVPLSAYLGVVGMPGVTAWIGLTHIIEPKAGETIVVDAASGAVGGVVGQLAKVRGCRAIGIAGGPEKCAWVVDGLGFDACIDHRAHADAASLAAAIDDVAPGGIDGAFENVGGWVFDAVLSRMNAFGRIALCGLIAGYDRPALPLADSRRLLSQRLTLQGFIVSEHLPLWPAALKELAAGVAAGRLKYRETVVDGLASAPDAFLGLLEGRNFGKLLVKLA